MFGYSGSGHPGYSEMSVQSPGAHAQLPSIPSLFSHLHSHGSPGPGPATPDTDPYYHPSQGPSVTGFPGYQTQLKRPKKKPRSPKMGPDGIPCKRKSREGTTTYLWEFLLKLLQVQHLPLTFYMTLDLNIRIGQRLLPEVHKVGQQGEGHLQAGGQQGGVQALGAPQEQAGHELRDHGPSTEVTDQLEKSLNRQEIIFYTCLYFPSLDITTSAAS